MSEIDSQIIERKVISLKNLYLDPNNYRFIDNKTYRKVDVSKIKEDVIQRRTLNFLVGDKRKGIEDLIKSFKSNGFLPVDQIQAEHIGNGAYRVLEGNRRVAALKVLQEDFKEQGIDIGKLNPEVFSKVPIIVYTEGRAGEHEIIMGLKHITGNKPWPVLNQAQLVSNLIKNHSWTEDDAIQSLGIKTKHELRRNLRTIELIEKYKESDFGDQFETDMFGIFREIVSSTNLKQWLEWNEETYVPENSENTERLFSWLSEVSEIKENEEGEEITVNREKIITKSGEVSTLAKIINDPAAIIELEEKRNISDAYSASNVVKEDKYAKSLLNIEQNLEDASVFSKYSTNLNKPKLDEFINQIQAILVSRGHKDSISIQNGITKQIYIQYPNKQFEEIHLKRYRGFVDALVLKGLNRINLFAGENNTGKTSLLEAIYVLANQNDINAYIESQKRRGKFPVGVSPQWLNRSVQPFSLSGIFDGKNVGVSVNVLQEEDQNINKTAYLNSISIEGKFEHETTPSKCRLYQDENQPVKTFYEKVNSLCRATYSSPFTFLSKKLLSDYHETSIQEGTFDKLIAFIREFIDTEIEDITKVGEGDDMRFLVRHRGFEQPVDITQFGEGLQRIFYISLQLASAKNGVMCIDEVENAIHHSLLVSFTRFLQELAENFNVQLFITTHSNECIRAFFENQYNNNQISGYRLFKSDKGISYLGESGESLQNQIENFSLDLRG